MKLALLITICSLTTLSALALEENKSYTYKTGGIERSYIMHIPQNLPEKAPLVIVLHGYGGNADPNHYGMNEVADKNRFAVCYPQGEKDGRGNTCWNVGYPFQQDMTIDDVDFLCKLVKHLQKKFNLSKQNVFCTGMSNGGEMCYLLAYKKPDVFTAVAPIAGLTLEWMYKSLESSSPIPLFEIHGTEDRISEWNGDLENKGGWGAYLPVPVAVNYWVAKNRCTEEKTDTLSVKNTTNGHYVITRKFINGIKENEVWLYEIVNGGHAWGDQDVNTSEEIWKFFRKFIK